MKPIDHVAFRVDKPDEMARWYFAQHDAKILYTSASWAMIEVKNSKFAFVVPGKNQQNMAFKVADLSQYDSPRSNRSASRLERWPDPFGIISSTI